MSCKFTLSLTRALIALGVTCLFMFTGCGSSKSTPTSSNTTVSNTATVVANFGPNGSANGIVNGIFTNVTVCQHGTTTCTTIDNVEVDTGSVGLRLVQGSVTLNPILQNGSPLLECVQYGDTSYSWGPMALADVTIAGETASNIAIQLLGDTTESVPGNCLTNPVNSGIPNGGNEDTLATLGANGILGIAGNNGISDGEGIVDCGSACTSVSFTTGYPYYTCPSGTCVPIGVATVLQAANPVAAFSSADKNGVMITFPPVGATGATSISGTMNFGIGTQSDNTLSNVTVYAMDACGDLPAVTFNGITYSDTACTSGTGGFGAFFDTGSNALYVLDARPPANTLSSLGISDCSASSVGSGFYCGTATLSNIDLIGFGNVGAATVSLKIADATTLFKRGNAVYNNLGGDSVMTNAGQSTDFFDFGAPFFFGRTVFIGIGGEVVSNVTDAPNGFVAF